MSIGLISFLNRWEELIVPSWPAESITTGMASAFCVATPRMLPIKQLLFTFPPALPIQITLVGRCDVTAGAFAQRNIFAAGGVGTERTKTDSRVGVAGGVAKKRGTTIAVLPPPVAVAKERLSADTRIGATGSVVKKCLKTDGCIAEGVGVVKERAIADGRVVRAGGVIKERVNTGGRVVRRRWCY